MSGETISIRVYRTSYSRMLGIVALLERRSGRRASMAQVVEALIDKYPKSKKGK